MTNLSHTLSNDTTQLGIMTLIPKLTSGGSFSRSGNPLLGNTTGFASTPENIDFQDSLVNRLESTTERYRLQRIAKKYHPEKRISACMCNISPDKDNVELHYHDGKRHAHYRNIMRCDSVWLCPVCSGRITSRRAEEIRQAYSYAVDTLKYRVVMVTYTMQHSQFDSLQKNLDDLRDARRKMRSGRAWQKFKKRYGYVGSISALEVTASLINGWHVHVHEIMFFDPSISNWDLSVDDAGLDKWLNEDLSQWWIDSLAKVKRSASLERGIDVTSSSKYTAEYIAKFGQLPAKEHWDVAMEVAKSNQKKNSKGLHPFSILDRSDNPTVPEQERKRYRAMWHEYADAFHGRKQIFWKQGLKELLLVDVVEEDGDIEEDGKIVLGISRDAWKAIRMFGKQSDVLNKTIICRGNVKSIEHYVRKIIADANKKLKVSEYRRSENETSV